MSDLNSFCAYMVLKIFQKPFWGLDSVVDNALACHFCGPGSKPRLGMWQVVFCVNEVK